MRNFLYNIHLIDNALGYAIQTYKDCVDKTKDGGETYQNIGKICGFCAGFLVFDMLCGLVIYKMIIEAIFFFTPLWHPPEDFLPELKPGARVLNDDKKKDLFDF